MKLQPIVAALLLMLPLATPLPVQAQSTKTSLITQLNSCIYANTQGAVTPQCVNAFVQSLIASVCGVAQASDCSLPTGVLTVTGLTGLGTGVAAALANSVGSAGSVVVNGGALGTPSSGNLSKLTGIWVTPQMFSSNAGSGGDDSAAIQSAVASVIASGGGTVMFPTPSSGAYNICASNIAINTATPAVNVRLVGTGPGGAPVQTLPGCASPPTQVFYVNAWDGTTQSNGRITFEEMRIDAYGLSKYGVYDNASVGLTMRNTAIRNSAPVSGAANFYQASGYETDIDYTVRMENVNDTGHTIYSVGVVPDYNLVTYGSDSHLWPVAVDAKIANYYQAHGGANDFSRAHGWGYSAGNLDHQPTINPQYNYLIRGGAILLGSVGDNATISAFYVSDTLSDGTTDHSGGALIGAKCEGGPTQCIEIDSSVNPVQNWVILGNATSGVGSPPIKIDGALDTSNIVQANAYVHGVGTAPYFASPGVAAQEAGLTIANPSTTTYALTGVPMWTGGYLRGAVQAQAVGTTLAGQLLFYTYNSAGSAVLAMYIDSGGNINTAQNVVAAHLLTTAATPTVSSCGTSPSVAAGSSNQGGQITLGTGSPTACTATFASAYPNYAYCSVTPASAYTGTYYLSSVTKTGFVITLGTGASATFDYACNGN